MSNTEALLIPLFREAWGASLEELARRDAAPFVLGEQHGALANAELREAEQAKVPLFRELVRFLWSRNQFHELDQAARTELARIIARALASIARGEELASALDQHRRELAAFVRAQYGESPREVLCAEYTPALQLAVLGLEGSKLSGPLLDLGCGPSASLVRTLRAQGMVAHGLDRDAPGEVASSGDWLTFEYGTSRWATVLSHLGFTLHFLHHHLARGDTAYDYARAYMAILRSLKPGGRFVYTPGLPFLESLLEAETYRVHHVRFADELRVPALSEIERQTGLDLSYASHVERLR